MQKQDNCDVASQEVKIHGLWKELESLKTDKNALMQELVKLRQHQESSENKLLLLTDRLQGMENNQQQMLSFLVMAMQIPGFMVQLLKPKENNWRASESGNMLEHSKQDDQPVPSDGMIMKYQPPISEKLKPVITPSCSSHKQSEPDLFADGLKDYFINSDFLKVLMDEKSCQLENHSPFILPDLPDDSSWEQLLLDSPFSENVEDSNLESDRPSDSGMEVHISQNLLGVVPEMDKTLKSGMELCGNGVHSEKPQSLESLTEHMELLASEANEK